MHKYMLLSASLYPASPCGPRGSICRRVVLLPGTEVGGWPSGEGRGGIRGWERGSFWQRSITGVYGPSTAIGRLPASRKAGATQLAPGAYSRCALLGVLCIRHRTAYEHTLPDSPRLPNECHKPSPGKCSFRAGFPDLLLVGPRRRVRQRLLLLCCALRPYPTPTSVASQTVAPLHKPDCRDWPDHANRFLPV